MISMDTIISGGVVSAIGLGTVFAVLAILWGVLEIMRVIFTPKTESAPKEESAPAPAPVPETAPAPAVAQPVAAAADTADDEELIAILTAAIAASLNTSTYKLNIKSYRQINNGTPVWNAVSRRENLQ
ncbi:MAG: OadG family protein [Clostridia bacterium]|nr:OadG family protein [Clostridia bacterium]